MKQKQHYTSTDTDTQNNASTYKEKRAYTYKRHIQRHTRRQILEETQINTDMENIYIDRELNKYIDKATQTGRRTRQTINYK